MTIFPRRGEPGMSPRVIQNVGIELMGEPGEQRANDAISDCIVSVEGDTRKHCSLCLVALA